MFRKQDCCGAEDYLILTNYGAYAFTKDTLISKVTLLSYFLSYKLENRLGEQRHYIAALQVFKYIHYFLFLKMNEINVIKKKL